MNIALVIAIFIPMMKSALFPRPPKPFRKPRLVMGMGIVPAVFTEETHPETRFVVRLLLHVVMLQSGRMMMVTVIVVMKQQRRCMEMNGQRHP